MSRKEDFVNYVEERIDWSEASEEVKKYWETVKGKPESEKPLLTDNGKLILKYMQESMPEGRAKDIAEGLFVSSKTVSGAARKLTEDGFLEKIGKDPVVYAITEKGKNITID